jgi:hypothetical protein
VRPVRRYVVLAFSLAGDGVRLDVVVAVAGFLAVIVVVVIILVLVVTVPVSVVSARRAARTRNHAGRRGVVRRSSIVTKTLFKI